MGATLKAGETAEYALGKDGKAYLVPATRAVQIEDSESVPVYPA